MKPTNRTNFRQVAVAPPQDDRKGSSLLYDESAHQACGDKVLGLSSPGVVWVTLHPLLKLVHMGDHEGNKRRSSPPWPLRGNHIHFDRLMCFSVDNDVT